MSDTTASKLTGLCTTLAAVGALVGLLVNSGPAQPTAADPVVVVASVSVAG